MGNTVTAPQGHQGIPGIFAAINNVRKKIDYIKKDKQITGGGNYWAVTHDQVTAHIRQHLIDEGVIIVPSLDGQPQVVDTTTKTSSGIPIIRFEAVFDVAFFCITDGSLLKIRVPAHALDQGDKAPGKAISYATKYAILKVFNIETGEDDEGRDVQSGATTSMPQDEYMSWVEEVVKMKPGDDPNPLWHKIRDACKKHGDAASGTKLKAMLMSQVAKPKEGKDAGPRK